MVRDPWEAWYHCMCNTYGTWIRGDSQGWRERHHRKHVDGDYKHPPAKGTFEKIQVQSKLLMKRDPVRLQRRLRDVAMREVVDCLTRDGVVVLVACLDSSRLHVL